MREENSTSLKSIGYIGLQKNDPVNERMSNKIKEIGLEQSGFCFEKRLGEIRRECTSMGERTLETRDKTLVNVSTIEEV